MTAAELVTRLTDFHRDDWASPPVLILLPDGSFQEARCCIDLNGIPCITLPPELSMNDVQTLQEA